MEDLSTIQSTIFTDTTILFNRKKVALLLITFLAIIILSIIYDINGGIPIGSSLFYSYTLTIFFWLAPILFAVPSFFFMRRLWDNKPAIIISEEGLWDNTHALSGAELSWSEMKGLSVAKVQGRRMLLVRLNDPEKFIASQKSKFRRAAMQSKLRRYGSPYCISTRALAIPANKLYNLIEVRIRGNCG